MEIANRLNGIGEYYFSTKLREIDSLNKAGKDIINLGIGSPDMPPHPEVIRVLQEESAKPNVHAYQSYKGSPVLRNAIAEWYRNWYKVDLDPETEILPLIGSKEGIMHICMTYLNNGDEVLVPDPGYPTYRAAVKLAGASCVEYELKEENSWYPDLSQLNKKDLSKVKLMFVNYPHMPTGQRAIKDRLDEVVKFARHHQILIVHDNPYSFILNDDPFSLLNIEDAKDCVIELNSLSKSHNMAGWRVGMLCGAKQKIDEVLRFKSNMDSGMFLPAQLAAAKALSLQKEWYQNVNEEYRNRREKAYELLTLIRCELDKNQVGMFLWAKVPGTYDDGYALSDEILYNASVFITPGGIFGEAGRNYVRISLCSPEKKISEALTRIKKSAKSF